MAENDSRSKTPPDMACEEIAFQVLDLFIEQLMAEANRSEGFSAAAFQAFIHQFKKNNATEALVRFRKSFEDSLREREREIWDQSRKNPFDRVLVKRFSSLFPTEDGLVSSTGTVSRRILPGFFTAFDMLMGPELAANCRHACLDLLQNLTRTAGRRIDWETLYSNSTANGLVDESLVAMAIGFSNFDKRFDWMLNLVNSHLAEASKFAFEGEAVQDWSLDREGLGKLLHALFSDFATRMADTEGRNALAGRLGPRSTEAVEAMVRRVQRSA